MPDRIARLARDKRGFPVPWVSCWGSGTQHGPGQMRINLGGGLGVEVMGATCEHVAGVGEPDLANLCSGNQIIGMTQRRCDVCGDVIDGPLHFVGAIDNAWFREPPLHLECAVYSLQVCPGISTKPGVGVVIADSYTMQPEFMLARLADEPVDDFEFPWVKRETFKGFVEAVTYMQLTGSPGVCMGIHAIPTDPIRITREQFLEAHQP